MAIFYNRVVRNFCYDFDVSPETPFYKLPKDIQYRYDKAGLRTGMVDPESTVIAYANDAARRMTKVTEGGNTRAEWLLDPAGRATKKTLGNSGYTVYDYDAGSRVTSLYNRKSDATVISSFSNCMCSAP